MAKKQRGGDEGGAGSWLNTYADMITLVLTFFIALYSMSTLNAEALDAIAEGQNPGGGASASASGINDETDKSESPEVEIPVDLSDIKLENVEDLAAYVKAYIEENSLQDQVKVIEGEGAVYIRFNSDVFFLPDRYDLRLSYDEAKGRPVVPILEFLGDCIKQLESQLMMVNIYGHTAEVKDTNYPVSALMLSSQRAASVAIYLEDEIGKGEGETGGISPELLTPIGQGNTFPVATNDTAEGRAQNRRVDIAVVGKDAQLTDSSQVMQLLQGSFDSTYPKTGGIDDVLFPQGTGGQSQTPPASAPEETANQPSADSQPAEPEDTNG